MPRAASRWLPSVLSGKNFGGGKKAEQLERWHQRKEDSKHFRGVMSEELERCLDEALLQMGDGVECVSLTGRMLGEAGVTDRLADAVKKSVRLKKLQLDNNRIDDSAMIELAEAMCGHRTLQSLDLDYNYISDKGAAAIAKVLVSAPEDTGFREIHLRYNNIGKAGAFVLAKALMKNNSLESLSLHGNTQIGPAGGAELAKALAVNTHLAGLSLFGCKIQDTGTEQLARGLEQNKHLRHLVLTMCGICDHGAVELASMLTKNQILKGLHLDDNFITDSGAQSIARALEDNQTLTDLRVNDNQLSKQVYVFFAEVLKVNVSLQKLGLSSVDKAEDRTSQEAMKSMRDSLASRRTLVRGPSKPPGEKDESVPDYDDVEWFKPIIQPEDVRIGGGSRSTLADEIMGV